MAVLIQNRGSQKPYIKILLRNQESFVVDGGTNTKYFRLGRGARQGHTTSAFLFVLALEILFHLQALTIATFSLYMLTIQSFSYRILSL